MRRILFAAALLGLAGCAAAPAPLAVQQAAAEPEAWCAIAADGDSCRRTSAKDHEACRKHEGGEYDMCRRTVEHLRLLVERHRRRSNPEIEI